TFFLDNILNNINNLNYLVPHLVVSSLIIISIILKNNEKYLVISLIIGFIYDILYYNIPYHIFIFLLLAFIVIIYFKLFKLNIFSVLILTIFIIFTYTFIMFLISIIYLKNNYTPYYFMSCFINSILLNIIYNIISFCLFCNNKSYYLRKKI
ncbi:MAG: rod shape-determining protein MreD, partial [bacterium]|nr:rod shape-determining protein MreD [bacterium]